MPSENVLICGGAGYIGSALVFRLLKDTDFNVIVFDNLMYGGDSLFPFFNFKERFRFIKGDLRTFDLDTLLKGIDYVVNLAALVGEPLCKKYPVDAQQINFDANIKLARTAGKKKINRYIFTSTCSNYGLSKSEEFIREDGLLQPLSLYAETKVNSEKILLNELFDLPVIVLRFATAYGLASRIRFDLLLHQFIKEAWKNKLIKIFGPESWRPMVHVDDIARSVTLMLAESNSIKLKDVYNVGSNDQNFQKINLAKMVADRFDVNIEKIETVTDPRSYKVSFNKIHNELNYQTLSRPQETINQIASSLESGLIDDKILYESVNIKNK